MRFLILFFILGLSTVAYIQHEHIQKLEEANSIFAGDIAFLANEIGGVSMTASLLSGQLDTVASIASSTAANTAELANRETADQALQRVVAEVSPAVVSIAEMTEGRKTASGTGFLVRSGGYIVTNRHVVDSIEPSVVYEITLSDGRVLNAAIITLDATRDIAVLKIPGTGYSTVPLGNSSTLQLGETVFAIGNALGQYSNSVSTGVISGLDRTITPKTSNGTIQVLTGVIQTDAAINRGNSGGPLVDLEGNAIGLNVATVTNVENISFSIPINQVKTALTSLGI